ncbi:MAG: DUF1800 domain-containing protein [Gemmatimonadetes bacterium]|nr:DUF1800 domain-containing protein [Gemmatimonadota bacterium]
MVPHLRSSIPLLVAMFLGPGSAGRSDTLTERERASHVLHRLAFGPRHGEVDRVLARGVDGWIADQLQPARGTDPSVVALLNNWPDLGRSPAELRRAYPPPASLTRLVTGGRLSREDSLALAAQVRAGRTLVTQLLSARVARAVIAERQLDEVMTDFWLNHFNVFVGKNAGMRYLLPSYEQDVIRPRVMGRFRDLLGAVAKSPAMLTYLDNAQSVADSTRPTLVDRRVAQRRVGLARRAVRQGRVANVDSATLERALARRPRGLNENYARELLELHTLGVDGGYSQQDVIEVARALTGWGVRPGQPDGFFFNRAAHDAGDKRILGERFPAGRGEEEGERVLDLLARHPSTARHIARKLAVRLVSDAPPDALVDRAAEVFRETDGDLRAVVRSIVTAPEFFDRSAWRVKVKSPFEVVVSAVRVLGGRADTTVLSAAVVAQLGQPLYGHQAPDGWPETGDEWMNTGAILARINFGLQVGASRVPGTRLSAWPDYARLAALPAAAQVDGVIATLLGGAASPETREILASGQNPLLTGPGADADPAQGEAESMTGRMRGVERSSPTSDRANPLARRGAALAGRPLPPLRGLDQLIALAIGSPEFQRR